jgi:SPP1 gp7 family putative phage head morphogenesis protein
MLADVSRRDAAGWHGLGLEIGRALRQEVEAAPTQAAMQRLYDYTVQKIVELPDDASERLRRSREFSGEIVRQMKGPAEEAMVAGRRWESLVKDVQDAGLHVQSSANTVARTETARASTTLQAVRAQHIGSELFQWITAEDADVRDLHRDLARGYRNGVKVGVGGGVYRWDDPPLLDDDRPGLPGTIYNCRCYALPVLPAVEE